jgi:hypothetical protein
MATTFLRFKSEDIIKLLEHEKVNPAICTCCGNGPGLMLAGYPGIFFRGTRDPQLKGDDGEDLVVYAEDWGPDTTARKVRVLFTKGFFRFHPIEEFGYLFEPDAPEYVVLRYWPKGEQPECLPGYQTVNLPTIN